MRSGFATASAGAPARGTFRFEVALPVSQVGRPVVVSAYEEYRQNLASLNIDNKALRVR